MIGSRRRHWVYLEIDSLQTMKNRWPNIFTTVGDNEELNIFLINTGGKTKRAIVEHIVKCGRLMFNYIEQLFVIVFPFDINDKRTSSENST